MRHLGGAALAAMVVLVTLSPVAAEEASLEKLPAVNPDGSTFIRAYRRWARGCKKPEVHVEWGGIDPTDEEPQYSEAQVVAGCGQKQTDFDGNRDVVLDIVLEKGCRTAGARGALDVAVPGTATADGLSIELAGGARTVTAIVTGDWSGSRHVDVGGTPVKVRDWYLVDLGKQRQLAVRVQVAAPDGGAHERWIEIWLGKGKPLVPEVAARAWLGRLVAGDAAGLAAASATPFERIGLEPAEPAAAKKCAKKRTAARKKQLAGVLACALVDAPARLAAAWDEDGFEEILLDDLPTALAGHKKKLKKLVKKGHALVRYRELVFAVKKGKVTVIVEAPISAG
jgi:hypothetical protein